MVIDSLAVFFFATLPIEQFRLGDTFQFCPFTLYSSMFRNNNVHSDQGNERLSDVSKVYNIRYHRSDVICYLGYFDCSYSVLFSQSNASVFMFTEKSATVHYHWSWLKKRQSLLRNICVCTMYYVVFSCFVFFCGGRPRDVANCMHLTCYSLESCKDMSLLQKMRVCGL